jgi:uncharacterized protein (UPF0147 family)
MPTLASQPLPRRVRELLGVVLKLVADELQSGLHSAVKDFEQQFFRLLDATHDRVLRDQYTAQHDRLLHGRADLVLHFFNALEAELALLQDPQILRGHMQVGRRKAEDMALVHDLEIEETSVLTDAANRAELQHSLPLFLLGQRFGVLGGRPAFDVEALPVGPQALCRSIRFATERLGIEPQLRLLYYRAFDRQIMPLDGNLVDQLNGALARLGVLPTLQYVPVRARRTEQKSPPASGDIGNHGLNLSGAEGSRSARGDLRRRGAEVTPLDAVQREAMQRAAELLLSINSPADIASDRGFDVLRQLMASRRQLLGKLNPDRGREGREAPAVVGVTELQEALWGLQNRPLAPVLSQGRSTPRNIGHLKQDMLALLRRLTPDKAPALSEEHNDAIDLVAMLYDNLLKDLKPGSNAAALLAKLQVPMMRVALSDRGFFTRPEHPARQMINTVAETGMNWLGDEEPDAQLVSQVHSLVDRAVHEFHGDSRVFQTMMQELITHLQTVSRKAESAERRHVEAARGKEKLTLAREHATAAVEELIKDRKLPRFTRTMLSQAWTDVMALTSLRHGEDSPAWRRELEVAQRLIELSQVPEDDNPDARDPENRLQREIEEALTRVGYQGSDVTAIARRLVHPNAPDEDEASSRTELTMRLKSRARLGEDLQARKARRIPLSSAEQTQLEQLKQVPSGTWFEFVTPSGEKVRRRLAWSSTATDEAMFVNQRGQKNAEYPLEGLARMLAKGQASIVEEDKGQIIDRAWEKVLDALRSFAVPAPGLPDAGGAP